MIISEIFIIFDQYEATNIYYRILNTRYLGNQVPQTTSISFVTDQDCYFAAAN